MTSEDVRTQVSPMVIWMADAAIRQARKAITGKTLFKSARAACNRPEVETAAEVLFCMFHVCTHDIMMALIAMPEQLDGICTDPATHYLDSFVEKLAKQLAGHRKPEALKLREADWVLNFC